MKNDGTKKKSSTEQAYETIKKHILSHKLSPGTRLTSRNMAKLTGVSIIPVLHALQRLDSEGLVETIPGWGSRVILLDQETIRDKYYLREAIECQVVRILARQLTPIQRDQLIDLAKKLDEYGSVYPVSDRYWPNDHKFHLTLAHLSGSKLLLREIRKINLFRFMQRAREWMIAQKEAFPADHHMSIVEAILTGDPDVAEKVMREHIHHRAHGGIQNLENTAFMEKGGDGDAGKQGNTGSLEDGQDD